MAISSYNGVTAAFGAGNSNLLVGQRIINTGATSVAGRWHECFANAGAGGTGVLTGTAGVGVALNSATVGSLPQPNAIVSPSKKHGSAIAAFTSSTVAVPGMAQLTDMLYMYPSCVVTGAATTINNATGKPTRFNSGVGVQVSAFVVVALGAATPLLTVSYTNSAGQTGRTGTLIASAASLPVGTAMTGGTVATLGGPYMVLQAGDSGVQQINSYTITSGGTTGSVTFVLHRPVAHVPMVAANTPGERDLINQLPTMPPVEDGACLAFLLKVGGALTINQVLEYNFTTFWG